MEFRSGFASRRHGLGYLFLVKSNPSRCQSFSIPSGLDHVIFRPFFWFIVISHLCSPSDSFFKRLTSKMSSKPLDQTKPPWYSPFYYFLTVQTASNRSYGLIHYTSFLRLPNVLQSILSKTRPKIPVFAYLVIESGFENCFVGSELAKCVTCLHVHE